ncbi:insulinase family protein [Olivibacter sp. SDN3]|uniref:M16 family metallopeptidase n=1 Tax=Olivibacter sp. SDN3 TaxID=2764720 RepID=UPI00165191E4|nr:pitrilysin family protein [Olivibacter sp. SDN3]QNL51044.1 insulinase family protein [Olivibacter sp. SDN3]
MKAFRLLLLFFTPVMAFAQASFKIDYERFVLENGLNVVFHVDRSDPVVSVNLTAHVGSSREREGRTGFAHLFEHLLFLESENLGKGGLDKLSAKVGGSGANGSTSRDRTNYLQTVPNDALEKMLWAEADKLGWFINTVTDPVLAKEKQVVKNEKRQGVDNWPYGHTQYVIDKALYPANHPYHWQVIGSLDDLDNAELQDVKDFFNRWYVPNNVTLVVAGDFDTEQAKQWVHKYFDEIKRGTDIPALEKRPGQVKQTLSFYHEDNFARLPELTYAWPTVEEYHSDAYALQVLTEYLTLGKRAPFYRVLVEKRKLTAEVEADNYTAEIAGQLQLSVRAFAGKDLDEVAGAIQEAFALFEQEGIAEKDLNRIKAGQERRFYSSLSSVLGKGATLAHYNIFAGDPGFLEKDIQKMLAVSREDVMQVYEKYIKGKPYVATSFVPKGQIKLALDGAIKADVVEEPIIEGAEVDFDTSIAATYEPTPSIFDRSVEPPYGGRPALKIPTIWERQLGNGLKIYGIENNEVPLVQFNIRLDGGQLLEERPGVANMVAQMLLQGTKQRTAEELEEAIEQLGAQITVRAAKEYITFTVTTLARNYDAMLRLLEEILLEPRWDATEFALQQDAVISKIRQQEASPEAIAENKFREMLYGKNNIYAQNVLGTEETVRRLALDDLRTFYTKALSPANATLHIVGALDKGTVWQSVERLNAYWKGEKISWPSIAKPDVPQQAIIYFYDVPDAKQSILKIGYSALPATDKSFYPATVANYVLGGGGFASRLTQELRERKGYTYGIRSAFQGSKDQGTFEVSSGVRANITMEAIQLIYNIMEDYPKGFNTQDLETTKGFLIKSQARAFETAGEKLGLLENISAYNWPYDYVKQREAIVHNSTVSGIQALAKEYLNPNKMVWLVVGDAKTQLPRLQKLGFAKVERLN